MDESKQERLWALVPPSNVVSLNPSVDALLDSLIALFYDCKATRPGEDSYMGSFVKQCQCFLLFLSTFFSFYDNLLFIFSCSVEPVVQELSTARVQEEDFETIKVLGRGGFGEVKDHSLGIFHFFIFLFFSLFCSGHDKQT